MPPLQQNIHAYIRLDADKSYVAECMEIAVVTHGKTLDEVRIWLRRLVCI